MLSDEEKARRESDAALIRKANELESFCDRLLFDGGKRGQISDIRAAQQSITNARMEAIRREHDEIVAEKIRDLMGSEYMTADADLRAARDAIDGFENIYLLDICGKPITCALTGVPLTADDWYFTDDKDTYILAEAAGLSDQDDDEADAA